MIFTVLVFTQMGHVLAIRSDRESLLSHGLLSNRPLLAAVAEMILLQAAAIYFPPFQKALKTQALGLGDLAAAALSDDVEEAEGERDPGPEEDGAHEVVGQAHDQDEP